ncbi:glycosyltransferase family 2 protein [Thalassospira mesophila]|uniref:glycosyltransferase family 2 protein n=1 Tax=Thalassospira mesophila TaxID=1293891 RepID=UPI000A1EA033|nr:glycosyltransferase family 2 protein [Thalassospira mesophila]
MNQPLVTIGLTTYNATDSVKRAIKSALAQTWRPIEIIICDDCSSDTTPAILSKIAEIQPEIRLFRNSINSGVATSRNQIIKEARGEYIAFFDDDDESSPDRIAIQVNRIVTYEKEFSNGAPVICHAARQVIYPNGMKRIERTMGERIGAPAPFGLAVAHRILMGTPLVDGTGACPTCSQMARTSTYRDLGGFDPALRRGEDTEFNIRLAQAGGHFAGIGKPLVSQTMTQTSDKSLEDEHRYMLIIMKKHRDIIEETGQYNFCLRWLEGKQAWLKGDRVRFGYFLIRTALTNPVQTFRRLSESLPNLALNRAFRKFHDT